MHHSFIPNNKPSLKKCPLALGLALGLAFPLFQACESDSVPPSSAFNQPIDFAYACEGDGQTVPLLIDESPAKLSASHSCPSFKAAGDEDAPAREGALFGLVLERQPPSLIVLQLNHALGRLNFIDSDYFKPGVTGIPVGSSPIRLLSTEDKDAFYVISAGEKQVDRVRIKGWTNRVLDWEKTSFPLPHTPIDAALLDGRLFVASQSTKELFVYDIAADGVAPPLKRWPLPDIPLRIEAMGQAIALSFKDRPTLLVLSLDGDEIQEESLVPSCQDGLDNDGDGLIDALDPSCQDPNGEEGAEEHGPILLPEPMAYYEEGASACSDGIDNNGDGLSDFPGDPACESLDSNEEYGGGCASWFQALLSGLIDTRDFPCYHEAQIHPIPKAKHGPFQPAFISAKPFGEFLYVVDESKAEILVYAWDDVTKSLSRINVQETTDEIPPIETVPYDKPSAEATKDDAVPVKRALALAHQGNANIVLGNTHLSRLSSSRLRGEFWEHLIPEGALDFSLPPSLWQPSHCSPLSQDRCLQPEGDDDSWVAFGPNLDGHIQVIEVVRRGVPVHRLAQKEQDLSLREHKVSRPHLTRRDKLINARGEPQVGFPFLGPPGSEILEEAKAKESPRLTRRFGIWPPSEPEESLSESWTLTYQGVLPETPSHLGVFSDEELFQDPNAHFCSLGAAPNDWLQLSLSRESVDPSLLMDPEISLPSGQLCPTIPPKAIRLDILITDVGEDWLTVDFEQAFLRPQTPLLDLTALKQQNMPRRTCQDALKRWEEEANRPSQLTSLSELGPHMLPPYINYQVRAEDWIAVGSRSGFLHRQAWDEANASCVQRDELDPRITGRLQERKEALPLYETCPPSTEALRFDGIPKALSGGPMFENPSFKLDIFPACSIAQDGSIQGLETQQDTQFTFEVTSPQEAETIQFFNNSLSFRVPVLDERRQQMFLDTSSQKVSLFQYRFKQPSLLSTFE